MANNSNMTPVFLKSDSVLYRALLMAECESPARHESYMYDMVMSWMQDVRTEQVLEGLEPENNTLLGVEFWESLKDGMARWTPVPGGLHVYANYAHGHSLDFGSADEHDELILCHEYYNQCSADHYTLVTTVEVSEPAQDWISQEMIKPHVRVIKEMLKFTDGQIRSALETLHDRGEEVTFASLIHILTQRENAVINVYVGTRQYAFSADVQLVLHECYDIYEREPTQPEFDYQWNRIKGTGIEHLINQVAEKDVEVTNINRDNNRLQERARLLGNQVATEKARAVQERNRADRSQREKLEAIRDVNIAMEARNEAQELANEAIDGIIQEQDKAEAERVKAVRLEKEKEEERVKAETERVKAVRLEKEKEKERVKAETERVKAVRLEKEKEEERVKAETERVKAVRLEKEKEEERVKAETERVKAETERVKAVRLEKEKEEERVKAETERVKAETERVKAVRLEKEKEEERVKAETERVKAETERVKAVRLEKEKEQLQKFFEEEKRKIIAQFEAEKRQLLLQMQQPSVSVR